MCMKSETIVRRFLLAAVLLCGSAAPPAATSLRAQAPGVVIERGTEVSFDEQILDAAMALKDAGKLVDLAQTKALIEAPETVALTLPAPAKGALSAREVYRKARAAFVTLGWFYLCTECDAWHLSLGAGYAIARDGVVATAAHNLTPDDDMKEAYLLAITADDRVLPMTSILALDEDLDTGIVRIKGFDGEPLALSEDAAPGDRAFCFSDPLDLRGYFTAGTVNRFYWMDAEDGDTSTLAGMAGMRLNVGTDWAPGSSGAAVLDEAGNAIGHVSAIAPIGDAPLPDDEDGGTADASPVDADRIADTIATSAPMFQLHDAIPARSVLMLARALAQPAPRLTAATAPKFLRRLREFVDRDLADADGLWHARRLTHELRKGFEEFRRKFPDATERWSLPLLEADALEMSEETDLPRVIALLQPVIESPGAPTDARRQASRRLLEATADRFTEDDGAPDVSGYVKQWDAWLARHDAAFPDDDLGEILVLHLQFLADEAPEEAALLAEDYARRKDKTAADGARTVLEQVKSRRALATRPMELSFTALDGREVDFSKLRGKVVLVDFWATWCGPCMEEVPDVVDAYRRFKDKGFAVIGISLDEDRKALERSIRANGMGWPQKFSGKGWDEPLAKQCGVTAIPTMWLLNREGRVVDWDAQEDLADRIEKLLGAP
jgi:thiol-disulfide isomerase/thioredoxin